MTTSERIVMNIQNATILFDPSAETPPPAIASGAIRQGAQTIYYVT